MTKAEITLTYSDSSAGETENYWLRIMDSEDLKDLITREEAAEFIDTLYDIDPCSVEGTEGGVEPEKDDEGNIVPPVEEEEFADLAKRFLSDTLLCGYDDSSYDAEIIVARSHQQYPYKLVFDNGEYVSTRTVNEEVSFTYVLNKQSSFSLEFPVLSSDNFSFEWNGNVYNERGVVVVNPEYRLDGSTLYFNESLTGSFTCEYETRYDIVTVHVYGEISLNSAYAGQPRPKPEECNVLGFYQGTVTEHTITPPDEDETTSEADMERLCLTGGDINPNPDNISCYEIVTIKTLCRCSGDTADSRDVERSVTCPDRVKYCSGGESTCRHFVGSRTIIEGYTSCPDEEYLEGTVSDPEFYLEKCCHYPTCPPWCPLPPCETIRREYPGSASFNGDKSNYPPNTQFIAVGPKDGMCGTITTTFQVAAKDCCEDVEPLEWDEEHCSLYVPGWYHIFGGKAPFIWRVSGVGLSFHPTIVITEIETDDRWVYVYRTGEDCGAYDLLVTDVCNQHLDRKIRSPEGRWMEITLPWNAKSNEEKKADHLGCGWNWASICCSGPWTFCYVTDSPTFAQCYQYYSAGIGRAAIYLPEDEEENGEYKIVRTSCASYRNCYGGCYYVCQEHEPPNKGYCTIQDSLSGLSFEIITGAPHECGWIQNIRENKNCAREYEEGTTSRTNYAQTIGNKLYQWVC